MSKSISDGPRFFLVQKVLLALDMFKMKAVICPGNVKFKMELIIFHQIVL